MTSPPKTSANAFDSLHGDLAFWFFAMAELCTIGIGLVVFAVAKRGAGEEMQILHDALHRDLALVNTIILLTSGALVAMAVNREQRGDNALKLWLLALVIGTSFLVVKGYEFSAMASAGFNLSSSTLISGYFLLTGFHYLHVALGVFFFGSIAVQRLSASNRKIGEEEREEARAFGASAGVFWHSLDLMWIVIFAVVYA